MPNYADLRAESIVGFKGGKKSFVGQADDSFFLDLRIFDLLYGGDLSERGADTWTGSMSTPSPCRCRSRR